MKGSVILSLTLDVSAMGVMLIPGTRFRRQTTHPRTITNLKRGVFLALLLSGFLVDHFISHPG